jgi:hypothetical protein
MTINFYANYGILAHEKRPVFSTVPGEINDKMSAKLPEGWGTYAMQDGQTGLVAPWGDRYAINDVLVERDGEPWFSAVDDSGRVRRCKLSIQ